MSTLLDSSNRDDLLNRLKRAEGQVRGIQRMVAQGDSCTEIASQMTAVRRALDSAYARMTVCFIHQALLSRLGDATNEATNEATTERTQIDDLLAAVQPLLQKMR